jgi:hypothetical protein
LSIPTKTIIPTRNKITSKEANLTTLSKSIVLVIKRKDVPKKAKVRRKLQKNKVPNMETENMAMAIAWWEFRPMNLLKNPNPKEIVIRVINFFSTFAYPCILKPNLTVKRQKYQCNPDY